MRGDAQPPLVRFVDDRAVDVGREFLVLAVPVSTQIFTMSTLCAASSPTALRPSASLATQYGAVVRPGSGIVIPRPALR